MVIYEPKTKSLKVTGFEETTFDCGESLDKVAVALIGLKYGSMTLQHTYNHLAKLVFESVMEGKKVLRVKDGEVLVSKPK
jgi:hypothetical protein